MRASLYLHILICEYLAIFDNTIDASYILGYDISKIGFFLSIVKCIVKTWNKLKGYNICFVKSWNKLECFIFKQLEK